MFNRIEIEISSHCNLSCSYCPNSVSSRTEQGEMNEHTFYVLLDQLQEINYQGIFSFHFYNEPLLAPHFFQYLQILRTRFHDNDFLLYSNGTKLDKKTLLKLLDYRAKIFITKHEQVKKIPLEVFWSELTLGQTKNIIIQPHEKILKTNRGGLLLSEDHSKTSTPCFIPQNMVTVTLEGNIVGCFEDYHQKNIMGNIHKNKLQNIWDSKHYKFFRNNLALGNRHHFSVCSACDRTQVQFI